MTTDFYLQGFPNFQAFYTTKADKTENTALKDKEICKTEVRWLEKSRECHSEITFCHARKIF